MLSRIARQKNASFHLRHSRSSLPTLRLRSHSTRPTPMTHAFANDQHERSRQASLQSNRNLATAADQPSVEQRGSYVPFDDSSYSAGKDYNTANQWASFFPPPPSDFDPSSLIIVDDFLQTRPKIIRKRLGMGGDEDEMITNLDISLKVGQFDRAASIINRLGHYFPVGSPEFLAINNRYLEAMVSNMILTRQYELTLPLQRWFEVDMPSANVKPDATTLAIMVKMALRMLHGAKRDRTVRRYWHLAKDQDAEEELLAVPVLSEWELGELSEICSSDLQRLGSGNSDVDASRDPQATAIDDGLPAIRPVEQKGLGLSSLKESLSLFSGDPDISYPANPELTPEERNDMYDVQRQRRLESDSIRTAIDRWRREFEDMQKAGVDITSGGKRLGPVMNQWHTDLESRIKEELKLVAELESRPPRNTAEFERCIYGVFLKTLKPDKMAALTILSLISSFSKGGMDRGMKLVSVSSFIGRNLQDEIIANEALKKNPAADIRRRNVLKKILAGRKEKEGRMRWQNLVRKLQDEDPKILWPLTTIAKVGAVLLSFLFEVGKVPVLVDDPVTNRKVRTLEPAFHHSYQITWGRRHGLIHMHPAVVRMVAREPSADMLGRHLPMVSKPKPWGSANDGGYLLYQSNIVRSTPGETLQPAYINAAMENDGLKQVRAGLDILGSTGWCINRNVFDVMLEAWNSGEAIGNLSPLEPDLPFPPKPSPEEGFEAEQQWHVRVREIENRRSGHHSIRCFQNFQMEVARAYRNDVFYLPHNIDFRGRAYPLPPYLNQMGADNSRALLLFSDAKPLGENGMKWLKVQIANLAGFDKASISEREQFATDHIDDIIDSADKGLHGNRWWLRAEDPWQCLAACCELRNALAQPDPTQYLSRLPIHQDGSCNGLQHYAALGGDSIGAQQVNLEPSDRPSDVYTGVADFVKETVARDAANGNATARLLQGKVTRKIVKQTVMTNVYGVTFLGAMRQIRKQLIDHYPALSREENRECAVYIAKKVFEALGTMFNGAHEIQYWLGDCATRITQSLSWDQIEEIAKEALTTNDGTKRTKATEKNSNPSQKFKTTVIWTTPLGLPVVQPYRTRQTRRIYTSLQDLSIADSNAASVVSRRKQLQAFPPNFIHSLDATHMMLSALACEKAGLTFSAVHDSFWTHAGDVDSMNQILREAFVRMHSDDVVKRLAEEFKVRYGNHIFLSKVSADSDIGKAIRSMRKSRDGKSAKTQELLDEYKRQKLLQSGDPELEAQGRQMTTAAAIFERMGCTDRDLAIQSSLGQQGVGHVPEDLRAAGRRPDTLGVDPSDPAIETLLPDLAMTETNPARVEGPVTQEAPRGLHFDDLDEEEPSKKKKSQYTWLWLPMWFRDIPSKGAWDLKRIRESQYFFS